MITVIKDNDLIKMFFQKPINSLSVNINGVRINTYHYKKRYYLMVTKSMMLSMLYDDFEEYVKDIYPHLQYNKDDYNFKIVNQIVRAKKLKILQELE